MTDGVRLNKVIGLLEQGKAVFCGGIIPNGNLDDVMYMADSDYDFCIIENEHEGFSFNNLRNSMQHLLNRKRIAEKGSLQPDVVPFVRISPNARETADNQWVIKQTLDTGVYGLVIPHLNTAEEARAVVQAARYPQVPGSADFEPEGERGWWQRVAPRYWGLTAQEYYDVADLWPLDPTGEIVIMGIVEEPLGVKNIRDILKRERGIGAIWAGAGDMSIAMGKRGNSGDPEVQEALMRILEACKEVDVPCAIIATAADVERRLEQGFRIIVAPPRKVTDTLEAGRKAAGR